MRITSFICMSVLCLFAKTASAQVYIDLVNAGISQNLKSEYKGSDNIYQQQTSWFNANVPFVLNDEGDFLMPNLQYSFTQLQHDFFDEDELGFHNINLGLTWLKNWKNPYWSSYMDLGTGLSADLKTVTAGQYNYTATLLFFYGKRSELIWNFGMNYIGGSFGNYIVPLVGVDWIINEKTVLSYQTFSHFQLDRRLTSKVYAGLIAHTQPFSFNVTDYYGQKDSYIHSYSSDFPYVPQVLGVYADLYLINELTLFGKLGYEFSKTLFHQDMNGEHIIDSPFQGNIKSGPVLELGVAWRKRTARKFKYH